MIKTNSLKYIISVTMAAVIILPIFIIFYVYPSFEQYIVKITEDKAVKDAKHLVMMYSPALQDIASETFTRDFSLQIEQTARDFDLYKIKVFSSDGTVQYSSDPLDVGVVNQEDYFHQLVAKGKVFSKIVKKNTPSLEGETIYRDVIEIYVPLMKGPNFLGAFEIYYDITSPRQDFDRLIFKSSVALFAIVSCLLLAVMISSLIASQSQSKQRELETKLRDASITDELTGLYNRRGFMELAEKQLKIAQRTKEELLLLFADFDNLKWINDTCGHHVGDQAIIETALVLQDTFREADVIGRLSGDEFVVLLTAEEGQTDEYTALDRLYRNIQERNKTEGRKYTLSLSAGQARQHHQAPSTIDELLSKADSQMYKVKNKKKQAQQNP